MLIAISGRKHSGKSTICNLLLKKGFKKASFAAGLKEYLAKLYNWDENDLNTQEGKELPLDMPVLWNQDSCNKLSKITGCDLKIIENKEFKTRREALQYIGTEVLRGYDSNFHLKEFKKRFSKGNYICDDMRFENEFEFLKSMNAVSCFVIRPYYWHYNNHESEVSLSHNQFNYVLVNDGSLHKFIKKSKSFLKNCIKNKPSKSKIKHALNHQAFSNPDFINSYWAGVLSTTNFIKCTKDKYSLKFAHLDKNIVKAFKDFIKNKNKIYKKANSKKYSIAFCSPYLIEDLKKWNLEPKNNNNMPDCLKSKDLMLQWLVGVIDGAGSIYFIKDKEKIVDIGLEIVASSKTIDYISNVLNIKGDQVSNRKKLFSYKLIGQNAINLYEKIYAGYSHNKDWSKFDKYKNIFG